MVHEKKVKKKTDKINERNLKELVRTVDTYITEEAEVGELIIFLEGKNEVYIGSTIVDEHDYCLISLDQHDILSKKVEKIEHGNWILNCKKSISYQVSDSINVSVNLSIPCTKLFIK